MRRQRPTTGIQTTDSPVSAGGGRFVLLLGAVALLLAACAKAPSGSPTPLTGSVVDYGRGPFGIPLRGVLYVPAGPGPFPVLLYAHGSAPGSSNNQAFEAIAPEFTSRGWAVFAPYRRGQGLSSEAGPLITDEIAAARRAGGTDEAQARLAQLLADDHMNDHAQAFGWLWQRGFVDSRRVAVMGNSLGGVLALLSAEQLGACAAVNAAGGAESWDAAPALRALMIRAASRAEAPVLFMQAQNDVNLSPSRVLAAVMRRSGKRVAVRIYPPFGETAADGHSFAYRGVATWGPDVRKFLADSCR